MYWKPLAISMPSDGSVGGRPSPKNDSVASSEMAFATCSVATTISGGSEFGSRWRKTMRAPGSGGAERGAGEIGVLRRDERRDQLRLALAEERREHEREQDRREGEL